MKDDEGTEANVTESIHQAEVRSFSSFSLHSFEAVPQNEDAPKSEAAASEVSRHFFCHFFCSQYCFIPP